MKCFSAARIVVGSMLLCTGGTTFGQAGMDVPVDVGTVVQNEISLDLIPGTTTGVPQLLVGAYNDNPMVNGNGVGVSYSTDGGATWTNQQLAFPANTINGATMGEAFDPSVTIDGQGNIFVSHISSQTGYGSISGLYVHSGTLVGNAITWSQPVEVDSAPASVTGKAPDANYRFLDRAQIRHDPATNDLYLGYIKDAGWWDRNTAPPPAPLTAPPSDIWVAYSRAASAGSTWTPVQVNDSPAMDLGNMPVPVVDAGGTVFVSWLDYDVWNGGVGQIMLDISTNGGVTWGGDKTIRAVNLPPINVTTGTGNLDARAKGAPVLAASPTNAGELYLTYAEDPDGPGGDDADIMFIRSTNGGVTWSMQPTKLNRVPSGANTDTTTNDQILPWMDVKPNGTIDVAWYDRRLDPADGLWDVFMTRSTDGGQTWSPNVRINDMPFPTSNNSIGGPWIGEYLGLAVDSDHAYLMWTSTVVDGNGDIYFDKIPNRSVPEPSAMALTALALLGLLKKQYRFRGSEIDDERDS